MHFSDLEEDKCAGEITHSNFILEDLLSYIKVGKHPRWAIPREEVLESCPWLAEMTSYNRKSAILTKFATSRESQ
jgi:hypothetical protein